MRVSDDRLRDEAIPCALRWLALALIVGGLVHQGCFIPRAPHYAPPGRAKLPNTASSIPMDSARLSAYVTFADIAFGTSEEGLIGAGGQVDWRFAGPVHLDGSFDVTPLQGSTHIGLRVIGDTRMNRDGSIENAFGVGGEIGAGFGVGIGGVRPVDPLVEDEEDPNWGKSKAAREFFAAPTLHAGGSLLFWKYVALSVHVGWSYATSVNLPDTGWFLTNSSLRFGEDPFFVEGFLQTGSAYYRSGERSDEEMGAFVGGGFAIGGVFGTQ